MTYESLKAFKTKLLTIFSNEIIECNYCIGEYTVEYDIVVKMYEFNEEILNVKN